MTTDPETTDSKTADRERKALERALVDADARAAIAERRAQAHFLQPVMAAAGQVRDDPFGRKVVRYEHSSGWIDADELLDVLCLDPDFAPAFPDSNPSLTKTAKSSKPLYAKPNPFAKQTFSLTEQMRLLKTDPEIAARLKFEAN